MEKRKRKRKIDGLAEDSFGKLSKSWTLIKRKDILSWKGAIIIAFLAGIAIAVFSVVRLRMQISSDAAAGEASLYLYPNNFTLSKGDSFTTNIYLDTKGNKVVVAQAVIAYNPSELQLVTYDVNNSIFALGNSCIYNGKSCRIIENDVSKGKISLTLAKPTPGVNTANGFVGALNFKTLKEGTSTNVSISFTNPGDYNDSNVIVDDGQGTDIIKSVSNCTVVTKGTASSVCTSFAYSDWGECVNNSQSRTVASSSPAGCIGGNPVLVQSCKTTEKPTGGSVVSPPTCTEFTYTGWSKCKNNKKTRSIVSRGPASCVGGKPDTSQKCKSSKPKCKSYKYTAWGKCINGKMKRKVISRSPRDCSGGKARLVSKKCTVPTVNRYWWRWW